MGLFRDFSDDGDDSQMSAAQMKHAKEVNKRTIGGLQRQHQELTQQGYTFNHRTQSYDPPKNDGKKKKGGWW